MSQSAYRDVLEGVRDEIRGLGLATISSGNIVIRRKPWDDDLDTPLVVISPGPERISFATNEQDDLGYRCLVGIADASNMELVDNTQLWRELAWREEIRKHFHNKRPFNTTVGNTFIYLTEVEPLDVVSARMFREMYDAQFLVIVATVREVR